MIYNRHSEFGPPSPVMVCIAVSLLATLVVAQPSASTDPLDRHELTQQQRDGKRIFFRGESNSGRPVFASLGDPPMQVSARMLPCVNCHGYDARGRLEAGVQSSNISWSELTKPYGIIHANGRRHGPYSENLLKRAITKGVDPSSNRLGVGMPQFQMSDEDMAALIAYLKRIETDRDPGVTDTEVVLATVLPPSSSGGAFSTAVGDLLKARFKEVNARGGLYGRQLTLRVIQTFGEPAEQVSQLRSVLQAEPIFALIAPFIPGASVDLAALAAEREIPIIAPIAGPPIVEEEPNRFVFYLLSGLEKQVRVLVDDLARQQRTVERSNFVVLTHSGGAFVQLAHVVTNRFEELGLGKIRVAMYDGKPQSAQQLTTIFKSADGVFMFGTDPEVSLWLTHATELGVSPEVFVVSASLGEKSLAASQSYGGRVLVAFPNANSAQSPRARARFATFLTRHGLPKKPNAATLAAYCAASIFVEGVENAGRELRRERLIRELEGLYEFQTGLTRDVSFGPTRRVGVSGAYLVTLEAATQTGSPPNRWVELED